MKLIIKKLEFMFLNLSFQYNKSFNKNILLINLL